MDENTIKSMRTQHQYLLLSAPPEKEERFRELKATHGSCFAFHGSSVENWHSIMRRGLVNASGTALQVNGAAYGNGIYLSPNASTSFGYSRIHQSAGQINANAGSNRFLASENMHCIAICEGSWFAVPSNIECHG
jgi:poly [ADP-ribose] polymerase 6/8